MATDPKPDPNVLSVDSMREKLDEVLRRVRANGERFVLEENGEPQAVVMSIEEYRRVVVRAPDWLERIRETARESGLDGMTMDEIDAEISAARRERRAKEEGAA